MIHAHMKLASHLWQSRRGIYYLRIVCNGRELKRSLGMSDSRAEQLLALPTVFAPDLFTYWFHQNNSAKCFVLSKIVIKGCLHHHHW